MEEFIEGIIDSDWDRMVSADRGECVALDEFRDHWRNGGYKNLEISTKNNIK